MSLIAWCLASALGFFLGFGISYAVTDANYLEPETVTVEVEVVPEACSDAVESADDLIDSAINLSDITNGYVRLIPKAFRAGVNADVPEIKSVIKKMNGLTESVVQLSASLDKNEFGTLADDCLEHE